MTLSCNIFRVRFLFYSGEGVWCDEGSIIRTMSFFKHLSSFRTLRCLAKSNKVVRNIFVYLAFFVDYIPQSQIFTKSGHFIFLHNAHPTLHEEWITVAWLLLDWPSCSSLLVSNCIGGSNTFFQISSRGPLRLPLDGLGSASQRLNDAEYIPSWSHLAFRVHLHNGRHCYNFA